MPVCWLKIMLMYDWNMYSVTFWWKLCIIFLVLYICCFDWLCHLYCYCSIFLFLYHLVVFSVIFSLTLYSSFIHLSFLLLLSCQYPHLSWISHGCWNIASNCVIHPFSTVKSVPVDFVFSNPSLQLLLKTVK